MTAGKNKRMARTIGAVRLFLSEQKGSSKATWIIRPQPVCPLEETVLEETGAAKNVIELSKDGQIIHLWGERDTQPFSVFRQVSHTRNLFSWQNYRSPWLLQSTTYYEEKPVTISRTLEEAYQEAVVRAREKTSAKVGPDGQMITESVQVVESAPDVVEVQLTWRVLENMAAPQFIAN